MFERDGAFYADSRNVADVFGKDHKHVLRDIDAVVKDSSPDLGFLYFQEVNEFNRGAQRDTRFFNMTKDGFTLLAMGYTGSKAMQ